MRAHLPLFPRPSHYTGSEPGAVHKNPSSVSVRMALAFPDLYEVGMSYTGLSILYHTVNQRPQFWAERSFAPSPEAAQVLREHGQPLCTLESDTPLGELDAIGFHLTHELCYTNVLYMLDLGRIPLSARDRSLDKPLRQGPPLVMAGGGAAINSEPIAPYLDLMILGDGEEALPEVLEEVARAKDSGITRREFLADLARIPGVYVPALFQDPEPNAFCAPPVPLVKGHETVERRLLRNLNDAPYPLHPPQPFGAVHDRFTIEIARGCTRGCRFCHAGMVYRPVRERSLESLDRILNQGLTESGFGELSFLALSAGDFSALAGLFAQSTARCRAEQVSISLPSLRVGSVGPEIMKTIAGIRRTGATLAPEAGSARMRAVINKGITEEALLEHARLLFEHGWSSVKLYFMIGLPTETDADLDAILELCRKVEATAGKMAHKGGMRRLQVTAAVSTFVPKPHTPFQWEPQMSLEETRRKLDYLKSIFARYKRFRLRWHMPEMSWLEGVFSRGDRALAPLVLRAYEKGALFSSWNDKLDLAPWREAMAETGVDPERYLGPRDTEAPLAWDHLLPGVSKKFLLKERARALKETITPDCRFTGCVNCGVCTLGGRGSQLAAQAEEHAIAPILNRETRDQEELVAHTEEASTPPDAEADQEPSLADMAAAQRQELGLKAAHYRIWYAKTGPAIFLSQLELQSLLERALRRGDLPPSFSKGFHPLPLLSFGRALPVGVASQSEYFDIFLRKDLPEKEVFDRLMPQLPKGFTLLKATRLSLSKKQAQAVAEVFHLGLTQTGLEAGKQQEFTRAWQEFMDKESLVWTRQTRKGERSTDIRPLFREIKLLEDGSVRLTLDWSDKYLSPLSLARVVCPELSLTDFLLTKESQHFSPLSLD